MIALHEAFEEKFMRGGSSMSVPHDLRIGGTLSDSTPSAMKVVLISESGTMENLWLPSAVGGRRRFPQRDDLPPIYMEAGGNSWFAQLGENAIFFTEAKTAEDIPDRKSVV